MWDHDDDDVMVWMMTCERLTGNDSLYPFEGFEPETLNPKPSTLNLKP